MKIKLKTKSVSRKYFRKYFTTIFSYHEKSFIPSKICKSSIPRTKIYIMVKNPYLCRCFISKNVLSAFKFTFTHATNEFNLPKIILKKKRRHCPVVSGFSWLVWKDWAVKLRFILISEDMRKNIATVHSDCTTK